MKNLKKCPSAYAKFLKKSRDRLRKYPVGSSKYCKCCLKKFIIKNQEFQNLYCSKNVK